MSSNQELRNNMMIPIYENLMSIEEMCRHEWDISWSGGKDSTAAIILMHNYGIPIDRIIYIRMMYDETIPATLPIMTSFVDHAADVFRAWGYTVDIVKGIKTAHELAAALFKNSIHKERNGKAYGMYAFFRGHCKFMSVKERTIHQVTDPNTYHMIGYTADEAHRLHRLSDKKTIYTCDSRIYRRRRKEFMFGILFTFAFVWSWYKT